jgi:hypothetical protein
LHLNSLKESPLFLWRTLDDLAKKERGMIQKSSPNLISILKTLADFELAASELYRTCSQVLDVDKEFWKDMQQAELKHVKNVNRMTDIVSAKPGDYTAGHVFSPAAVQTTISGIKANIQRLVKREIAGRNMFFIARDLEQSMLERNYTEIVRTHDPEFQSLMKEMLADTISHRDQLDRKIKEMGS